MAEIRLDTLQRPPEETKKRVPLDAKLYSVEPEFAVLLKKITEIQDDEELKKHILAVQEEAYDACPYQCIRLFSFTRFAVTRHPLYNDLVALGKTQRDSILLEIGPGFGNDLRKIVDDGYPVSNIVATDIVPDLWECGHHLFRSNEQSFPVKFVQADIFDEAALSSVVGPAPARPDLRTIQTLTPLKGRVSIIIAQLFFHLFDRDRQTLLAQRLSTLLSLKPGSMIVGRHIADTEPRDSLVRGKTVFRHSPATWEEMWSTIFPDGTVEFTTHLVEVPRKYLTAMEGAYEAKHVLTWSVKRL